MKWLVCFLISILHLPLARAEVTVGLVENYLKTDHRDIAPWVDPSQTHNIRGVGVTQTLEEQMRRMKRRSELSLGSEQDLYSNPFAKEYSRIARRSGVTLEDASNGFERFPLPIRRVLLHLPINAGLLNVSHGTAVASIIGRAETPIRILPISNVLGEIGAGLDRKVKELERSLLKEGRPVNQRDEEEIVSFIESKVGEAIEDYSRVIREGEVDIINGSFGLNTQEIRSQLGSRPRELNPMKDRLSLLFMKEFREGWNRLIRANRQTAFVMSAGNDSQLIEIFEDQFLTGLDPHPNLVTVGAADSNGTLASFSSRSSRHVHVATLGEYIPGATILEDYPLYYSGTSFSAPQVTVALAEIWEEVGGGGASRRIRAFFEGRTRAITSLEPFVQEGRFFPGIPSVAAISDDLTKLSRVKGPIDFLKLSGVAARLLMIGK